MQGLVGAQSVVCRVAAVPTNSASSVSHGQRPGASVSANVFGARFGARSSHKVRKGLPHARVLQSARIQALAVQKPAGPARGAHLRVRAVADGISEEQKEEESKSVPVANGFIGGTTPPLLPHEEEAEAPISGTYDEEEIVAEKSESAAAIYAAIVADDTPKQEEDKAIKWPGQEEKEKETEETDENLPPIIKEATQMAKEVLKDDNVELALHLTNQFGGFVRKTMNQTMQWTAETSSETMHDSIEMAVALACGAKECTIEKIVVYTAGGVMMYGVDVGSVRMEKVLLRVSSLPMLVTLLNTWKEKQRQGSPMNLRSLRIHGMRVRNMYARSLQHMYSTFKNFPSRLSISKMVMANVKMELSPSGWSDNVAPERQAIHPWALPVVTVHRMELAGVWNEMGAARMLSCISDISEPQNSNLLQGMVPTPQKQPRTPASQALVDVGVQSEWRNEWRMDKVKELYEGVANVVKVAPLPIPESSRPELMQWADVERLSNALTEEGPSIIKAVTSPAALGLMDVDMVMKLVQQGVPAEMLRDGGETSVRMVESGVATAVLERGDLIKVMTERNILEPLIAQGVLEVALERPDMIIDLIQQGVISNMVASGTMEAFVQSNSLPVLKKLLRVRGWSGSFQSQGVAMAMVS